MNALQSLLPASRIPAIDGLRGIAIIFVIGFHGDWPGFAGGGYGVDLFFVISGFLITLLLIREKTNSGHISIKNFFLRRTLRIVPAYIVFLAGYFILCALLFQDLYPKVLESTIFAATYTTNVAFSWLDRDVLQAHTWSLSMEEQFYLAYPILVAFASRRITVSLTVLLIIAAPVWRTLLFATGVDELNPMRIGYGPDTRYDSILWGCLTAHLWTSDWKQRLKIRPRTQFLVVLLGVALVLAPAIINDRGFKVTIGYTHFMTHIFSSRAAVQFLF
jgi:peptidoglycan/LPS O-acetylase OafA/YrhL